MKAVISFALLLLTPFAFGQGNLTPSGTPGPTMRSLDQVEPRTPIPGGSSPYTISTSGSYKLTGNLSVAGGGASAITVGASDVTLDLGGFTVTAPGAGVFLNGGVSNVTIRHGVIRGCGSDAINGVGNNRVRVEGVRAINNTGVAIYVDVNAVVPPAQ